MKVKDLIEKLQSLPEDLEVVLFAPDLNEHKPAFTDYDNVIELFKIHLGRIDIEENKMSGVAKYTEWIDPSLFNEWKQINSKYGKRKYSYKEEEVLSIS